MEILKSFLGAIIAIPKIGEQLSKVLAVISEWYVSQRIAQVKKEYRDGIRKALDVRDQRDLEKAIGSSKAGEISGLPGTRIRDGQPKDEGHDVILK